MAKPNECPHCGKVLSDAAVRSMYGRMMAGRRRTKSGGTHGGRPPAVQVHFRANRDPLAKPGRRPGEFRPAEPATTPGDRTRYEPAE